MRNERIYFDANASVPLCRAAREAICAALDACGNGSSVHHHGRLARMTIDRARRLIAEYCVANERNIVFTSGASEANATVLCPHWRQAGADRKLHKLFVSAVEHPSVLAGGRFAADAVHILPVDHAGRVDPQDARARITAEMHDETPAMISVMAANNETGIIQPVREIAEALTGLPLTFHVDAVQLGGRMAIDLAALGADVITLSAHKLGGPQGVGAIVFRDDTARPLPLIRGGQEFSQRGGTENVAAIAGFGAAVSEILAAGEKSHVRLRDLRDHFEKELTRIEPNVRIFGDSVARLPNTVCFAAAGTAAETSLIALDLEGISVSSGSACSSGKVGVSHVLQAMNATAAEKRAALRISFANDNTEAQIDRFIDIWPAIARRQRERSAAA